MFYNRAFSGRISSILSAMQIRTVVQGIQYYR